MTDPSSSLPINTDPYGRPGYEFQEVERDYTLIPDGTPCRHCNSTDLWVEWRVEYHAKPITEFSLAGNQPKFSTVKTRWPWAVCGGCGHASRGEMAKPNDG